MAAAWLPVKVSVWKDPPRGRLFRGRRSEEEEDAVVCRGASPAAASALRREGGDTSRRSHKPRSSNVNNYKVDTLDQQQRCVVFLKVAQSPPDRSILAFPDSTGLRPLTGRHLLRVELAAWFGTGCVLISPQVELKRTRREFRGNAERRARLAEWFHERNVTEPSPNFRELALTPLLSN